jgi:SAM-dependent methyltransferase
MISKKFSKGSFDFVVDIENASLYKHFDRFLNNVNLVLKDDGMFFLAERRRANRFKSFEMSI